MADDAVTPPSPGSLTAQLSAASFVPPSKERLAEMLPDFEFQSVAGIGGMSVVYRVRRIVDDDVMAVKVMPPPYEGQEEDARRFVMEAKTMLALRHPNIVAVYDYGQTDDGHLWLLMEFVDGMDMHRTIRAGGIGAADAHSFVRQLCDAVQHAHACGVVHRDIKPANILISRDGRVKVTDFGVARPLAELARGDDGYGTPDYSAPERLVVGAAVDHRADIYSLGVVIHETLTGETPRQAARHGGARLPDSFTGVMSKCLMVDPARRYQTAREVGAALNLAIAEESAARRAAAARKSGAVLRPVPLAHPADLGRRRTPWLAEAGWALLCVGVIAAIAFSEWRKGHPHEDGGAPTFGEAVQALIKSVRSAGR